MKWCKEDAEVEIAIFQSEIRWVGNPTREVWTPIDSEGTPYLVETTCSLPLGFDDIVILNSDGSRPQVITDTAKMLNYIPVSKGTIVVEAYRTRAVKTGLDYNVYRIETINEKERRAKLTKINEPLSADGLLQVAYKILYERICRANELYPEEA